MSIHQLVLATRANRGLYIASFILVPCALARSFNFHIVILGITVLTLYSAVAILNALKDSDFRLPPYARAAAHSLILFSFLLGLSHKVILGCLLLETFLGYVYNNHCRRIPFGDVITLSITHTFIPPFAASLILGQNLLFALKASFFMMIYYVLLVNIKNQRDYLEDEGRGYKTHATIFKKHRRLVTANFIDLGYLVPIVWYLAFELRVVFLYFTIAMHIVKRIMINLVHLEKDLLAIELHRMNIYTFVLAIIVSQPLVHGSVLAAHILIISVYVFGLMLYAMKGRDGIWKNPIRSLLAQG